MTTEIMDTLLALKCGTCWGKKNLHTSWHLNECECPPCPDCRHPDTKQPTGLLIPELVEVCHCIEAIPHLKDDSKGGFEVACDECCFNEEHGDWCNCQGRGFVPVSEDTALRVLENMREFARMSRWFHKGLTYLSAEWQPTHEGRVFEGAGATPLESLAAAIKASVEVENHDN